MRSHAISDYLTPEYQERMLHRLVERLATKGFEPGESVQPRVRQMIADYRADRLRFETTQPMGVAA